MGKSNLNESFNHIYSNQGQNINQFNKKDTLTPADRNHRSIHENSIMSSVEHKLDNIMTHLESMDHQNKNYAVQKP
jgi:hypothetical protein